MNAQKSTRSLPSSALTEVGPKSAPPHSTATRSINSAEASGPATLAETADRAGRLGHRFENLPPPTDVEAPKPGPIQRATSPGAPIQRGKNRYGGAASLRSAKADRRAQNQQQRHQAKRESRRVEVPAVQPVTGGIPTGPIGTLLTLLMLSAHLQGASAQAQRGGPGRQGARPLGARPGGAAPQAQIAASAVSPSQPSSPPPSNSTLHSIPVSAAGGSIPPMFGGISGLNATSTASPLNATAPHLHGPGGLAPTHEAAPSNATTTAPSSRAPDPVRRPAPQVVPETTIDKSGKLVFGTEKHRQAHASGPSQANAVESIALNNLLRTTGTGRGVLSDIDELGIKPTVIRRDLGVGPGAASGEADLSNSSSISVNSRHDLRQNAITTAHEFRHREQFGHGILEANSNPYRMAAAEIEAKTTGVQTYRDLRDAGHFADDPPGLDGARLDSEDQARNPQQFKRDVFNRYLARYRGTRVAEHPDFESDAHLDRHIAAQEGYFATRRALSRIEREIKKRGFEPHEGRVPAELKTQRQAAREANKAAKKAVDRTLPKPKK